MYFVTFTSRFSRWRHTCTSRKMSDSSLTTPWMHLFYQPFETRHDQTYKMSVRPAKTQISLGIHPVWSESSLSAWKKLGSLATHWAHSEYSDQTGRMPRLIWVFNGHTATLLVLSFAAHFTFYAFVYFTSSFQVHILRHRKPRHNKSRNISG